MTRIFVGPEELADYHQQIKGEIPADMHLVAKDDDEEACLYISDKDGMPCITATLHGIEVETREYFEDSDDLENVARRMYAVYVGLPDGNTYKVADINEPEDEYTDDDLVDMFGRDESLEEEVEREEDEFSLLVDQVFEHLVGEDEVNYNLDIYDEVMDVLKEGFCSTLANYGFKVRRPTLIRYEDGSMEIEEYPYGPSYTDEGAEEI